MRIGGPVDWNNDPLEYMKSATDLGYRAVYCPGLSPADANPEDWRKACEQHDIVLAEVGAWGNIIAIEDDVRTKNIAVCCERLELADKLGVLCAVDYAGTRAPGESYGPHADNLSEEMFDFTVEVVRQIVDTVKPKRAKFALEMMQTCYPDNIASYRKLIDAIDRPSFGVHLDPVNIIYTTRQYYDTTSLLKECFSTLGPWIVSCHAKDIIMRPELALHFDETPPGTGQMDYQTFISELNQLNPEIPLMLEHLASPEEYRQAADFVRSLDG